MVDSGQCIICEAETEFWIKIDYTANIICLNCFLDKMNLEPNNYFINQNNYLLLIFPEMIARNKENIDATYYAFETEGQLIFVREISKTWFLDNSVQIAPNVAKSILAHYQFIGRNKYYQYLNQEHAEIIKYWRENEN